MKRVKVRQLENNTGWHENVQFRDSYLPLNKKVSSNNLKLTCVIHRRPLALAEQANWTVTVNYSKVLSLVCGFISAPGTEYRLYHITTYLNDRYLSPVSVGDTRPVMQGLGNTPVKCSLDAKIRSQLDTVCWSVWKFKKIWTLGTGNVFIVLPWTLEPSGYVICL